MRKNDKLIFITTSRWLIPVKYFDDEKYFIEIEVKDPKGNLYTLSAEEYKPPVAGKKEYRIYLK